MKERPILFSAPMVRAILEGRKTQTRRVVKPSTLESIDFCTQHADESPATREDLGLFYARPEVEDSRGRTRALKHPEWLIYNAEYPDEGSLPIGQGFGAVGDRLWVRETFSIEHACDGNSPPFNDGRPTKRGKDFEEPAWWQPHYRATDEAPDLTCESERCRVCESKDFGPHWKPSIHMPRWASRITLEVTGVRIERLQEISDSDSRAEGIEHNWIGPLDKGPNGYGGIGWTEEVGWMNYMTSADGEPCYIPRESYQSLWESINGAASWAANPWVWVIEFKRIETAKFVDITGSDEDAGDSPN